ncbi:hypothetical protein [Mastigocladopsis repens]|nr:hypothetical protein [Mastigocladopsis repens]
MFYETASVIIIGTIKSVIVYDIQTLVKTYPGQTEPTNPLTEPY